MFALSVKNDMKLANNSWLWGTGNEGSAPALGVTFWLTLAHWLVHQCVSEHHPQSAESVHTESGMVGHGSLSAFLKVQERIIGLHKICAACSPVRIWLSNILQIFANTRVKTSLHYHWLSCESKKPKSKAMQASFMIHVFDRWLLDVRECFVNDMLAITRIQKGRDLNHQRL